MVSKETVQILVIVFFSILILGGIILVIGGSAFEASTENGSAYFTSAFRLPAVLVIISGVFCLLGALLGLFGAILLGKWLLFMGVVFVFLTLVVSIAGGAIGYSQKNNKGQIKFSKLEKHFNNFNEHRDELDSVQQAFHCCGFRGGTPEFDVIFSKNQTKPPYSRASNFPASCCYGEPSDCSPSSDDLFETGCKPAIKTFMGSQGVGLLGTAVLLGIFEILAIVFGCLFISMFWGNIFKKGGGEGAGGGGGGGTAASGGVVAGTQGGN